MSEYPKSLYRIGDAFQWDGRGTDAMIAHSADDENRALAAGWRDANGYWAEAEDPKPRRRRKAV